jgi:catechol-2,3-dioxygenase
MTTPLFHLIQLQTARLDDQRRFYTETLGFKIVSEDRLSFAVEIGATILKFQEAAVATPLYHFALNIPENKIDEALAWTQRRTSIVQKSDGNHVYDFEGWQAHAFYFLDPEGNILEFIARHTLKNSSPKPFDASLVTCVSELGVVTADVAKTSQMLIDQLGWSCYPDANGTPGDEFQAVGSEQALFIVVKRDRVWLGSELRASPFPAEVVVSGSPTPFDLGDTRCRIS